MAKVLLISAICVLSLLAPGRDTRTAWGQRSNSLEKAASDVIAATLRYKAALERVLAIYERDLAHHAQMAELRRDLVERGVLSRREYEESLAAHADTWRNAEDTRNAISDADRMLTEAQMAEALARLAPLPRGSYQEAAGLARFNGQGRWSLAADTPRLQKFFQTRFGQALPVSAYGQTALHDQMGFDHRHALDVAVHPESAEGRTLIEYLRAAGIPFIAASGRIPGSASGAHIHIGQPSPRILGR